MIKVHAAVSAPLAERGGDETVGFASPFGRGRLLERAVATLQAVHEVDEVFVLTDDAAALTGFDLDGVTPKVLDASFFQYGLPLLSKEHWLLARALAALDDAGITGDVFVHLSWRAPLVGQRLVERLYHGLLEDRVAARTVAVSHEDPNLYTRLGPTGRLFPVWADLGQDRQRLPQLLRPAQAVAFHVRRARAPIPETKGIPASSLETLEVVDAEDLALAEFVAAEQAKPHVAPHSHRRP